MPVQGGVIGERRPPVGVGNGVQTIVVVDGKPSIAASDFESAIRIRAVNDANLIGNYGPIPEGEVGMLLEVKPEPKIQIQQILGVKIDKAIDNHDQVLSSTMVSGIIGGSADADIQQLDAVEATSVSGSRAGSDSDRRQGGPLQSERDLLRQQLRSGSSQEGRKGPEVAQGSARYGHRQDANGH